MASNTFIPDSGLLYIYMYIYTLCNVTFSIYHTSNVAGMCCNKTILPFTWIGIIRIYETIVRHDKYMWMGYF